MKPFLLSAIIPVFNEEKNVAPLFDELDNELSKLVRQKKISDYEIIFINDGSSDSTLKNLQTLKKGNSSRLKIIDFRRNFGQTPSLRAGFSMAKGDVLVTLDGDMQNDPSDIGRLLSKLEEGYDVVSGWRSKRKDSFSKKFFSRIMNVLRKKLVGDNLHDYGCSLKIYRRECVKDLQLIGELHRYITAYLYIKGYKIGEIEVNHRPRKSGATKYKFNRGFNGILDLLFLKFWSIYSTRPIHFFGRLGLYQIAASLLIVLEQIVKAIIIKRLTFGPLLGLASMLFITGILTLVFGFLSEMISRIYFKEESNYSIAGTY